MVWSNDQPRCSSQEPCPGLADNVMIKKVVLLDSLLCSGVASNPADPKYHSTGYFRHLNGDLRSGLVAWALALATCRLRPAEGLKLLPPQSRIGCHQATALLFQQPSEVIWVA
jgi:hypothetical protein